MEYKTFKVHEAFQDPDFGTVILEEDLLQPANSSYNCEFIFQPSGKPIKVVLKEVPGGPHQWQREFLHQLLEEYDAIASRLFEMLAADFRKIGIELQFSNFYQEFQPVFLLLEQKGIPEQDWELNFTTVHDAEYLIIVSFQNWQPVAVEFMN